MAEVPQVSQAELEPAIEQLLRTEDWDTVTVKLIMRKLEGMLAGGADLPPGWIAPHKKAVKRIVDEKMAAIIAENAAAGAAAGGADAPAEPAADVAPAEPAAEPQQPPEPKPSAADADASRQGAEGASRKRPADDGEAPPAAEAAADAGEEGAADEDEGAAGADAAAADDDDARFVGKPISTRNGKIYYGTWTREGVTYRLGMDVYLEPSSDAEALPYVARLVEIYAYAFAADEVYFNARWYYREADVRQYGLREAGRAEALRALDGELYLSLHEDENHADTVLRGARVCVLQGAGGPPSLQPHEYFCRYAYDAEVLHDISDVELVAKKKLRAVVAFELGRQPDIAGLRERASAAKRQRLAESEQLEAEAAELRRRRATFDELCAIALTRRTIEVWLDAPSRRDLEQVLQFAVVRLGQRLNSGAAHFCVCIVLQVGSCQPYKLGKRVCSVALTVKSGQGKKLVRLDALSNEPFTEKEAAEFTVPVTSYAARDKAAKLRALTQSHAELFSDEQRRQMEEADAQLQARLERERLEAAAREEEAARRERERDEVRERLAQKKVESAEQWWKTHAATGDASARERAKWSARLKRFEAIAASSAEDGERTNAARLAESARRKLADIS